MSLGQQDEMGMMNLLKTLVEYRNINYKLKLTVIEPVLSGHSKVGKTKVARQMVVKCRSKILQNALLEHIAILLTCIKRKSILRYF